jgi:PHD/YefM family antitoxin component YafN of YafNO toxin-antitoxin module
MAIHTFSSREFTRDVSSAKRLAIDGPVFITDRGKPAFALIKIDEYYRLTGQGELSFLDAMRALPRTDGIDFEASSIDLAIPSAELG